MVRITLIKLKDRNMFKCNRCGRRFTFKEIFDRFKYDVIMLVILLLSIVAFTDTFRVYKVQNNSEGYTQYYDYLETKKFDLTDTDYEKLINAEENFITIRLKEVGGDKYDKYFVKVNNDFKNTSETTNKKAVFKHYKRNDKDFKLYLFSDSFKLDKELLVLEEVTD